MKSSSQENITFDVRAISAERVTSCILKSSPIARQTADNFCTKQPHLARRVKSVFEEQAAYHFQSIGVDAGQWQPIRLSSGKLAFIKSGMSTKWH